ncbi:MAG: type II secretion system protein GspM [Candidatus Binatus sp.]|jgi:type II secretory pathway component PulM|uniref:type II secretion system protein GspM n=1 Tax=Candidatus Binatus sp. TaxID=2811406 RepID=UPI003C8D7E46
MLGEWFENLRERAMDLLRPYLKQAATRVDPLIVQARGRYQKLESRERILVQIAAGLVGVFLIYNLIYLPIVDLSSGLQARIVQRQQDLAEVRRLAATYAQLKADLAAAERRTVPLGKDFSLFSIVEASMTKSVGRAKIGSIAPGSDRKLTDGFTEYSVQLKLDNVSLAQLVDALYGINSLSMPIGVSNIRIQRRTQDSHSYDVDLTCVALAKNT